MTLAGPRVSSAKVASASKLGESQIVDARAPERFRGEAPDLRRSLSAQGRKRAELFSWKRSADLYLNELLRLATSRPTPGV